MEPLLETLGTAKELQAKLTGSIWKDTSWARYRAPDTRN